MPFGRIKVGIHGRVARKWGERIVMSESERSEMEQLAREILGVTGLAYPRSVLRLAELALRLSDVLVDWQDIATAEGSPAAELVG